MELDVRRLHGKRVAFRRAGSGPTIFLIHGITNSGQSWEPAMRLLARDFDVIAPDLPGHGESERQRGDHSLGGHACVMRDLLQVLEIERATVVGHSLGGGVAMQFSYQFPEMVRLILVGSGGLGRGVSPLIRSAALPFAEQVLPLLSPRGQRVTANDRLYLAAETPMLIVWGERDPIIPVEHGLDAHALLPNSRLELFEEAGHFPQLDDPLRFAELVTDFVATTDPATHDVETARTRLVEHAAAVA